MFILPVYLSRIQGYNAEQIGMVLAWTGFPQLLLIPLVPRLMQRFDARIIIGIGFALFAASNFMNIHMTNDYATDQLFWPNVVRAFGQALVFAPLSAVATAGIEAENAGSASGLFNMMRNLGGAVGIALLQTLLTKREQYHSNVLMQSVSMLEQATQARVEKLTQYFMSPRRDRSHRCHPPRLCRDRQDRAEAGVHPGFQRLVLAAGCRADRRTCCFHDAEEARPARCRRRPLITVSTRTLRSTTMNPRMNLDQASKGIPMLKDKVAIVTGSTSGIGLGIARELARQGANLVLNGFGDASEIEAIRKGIESDHGVRAIYDGADMSKADAVRGLITATIEKFDRLDILVNNAGIQFTAPVDEFPPAKWDAILGINLSATFHGIAIAVPQMKKQRWGRIVNIASTHGLVASTHKAAYVAAKHGLVGLTKVVGLETAGSGVTCNAVCPGWVRTPLVEKQISDMAAERGIRQQQAVEELLSEKQPSLDFASPEQLGGTVAFLCSPAADQITGTAISVDGGWTAQ